MSGETHKNESKDLTSFEAALRSLRPRSDGLDDQWPARLAQEASFKAAGGEGCVNPAGHQFLCIHCGSDGPVAGAGRHWGWPAAFSTMTAIAATLLAMIVTRAEPQISARDGDQGDTSPALSQVMISRRPSTPATELASRAGDEMPYLALRDQVLRDGVESWKMPLSTHTTAAATTEAPLNYREQLNRLLQQQDFRGS
jgi:hypothetical protein